jgi:hypothetical protein
VDLPLLRLLTSLPRTVPPSDEQVMALQVLSDAWIDGDRRLGLLLAERLQCEVTESRALALELDPGLATCDVRVLALRAPEVKALVERMAREEDLQGSVRVLSWLLSAEDGEPLHHLVATYLGSLLRSVETGETRVTPLDTSRFRLSNGWELDVFVRQHEFGRVDAMSSPEGFEVLLIDYAHGPLSLVRDYQPPPAIARDVYAMGLQARRRRMA